MKYLFTSILTFFLMISVSNVNAQLSDDVIKQNSEAQSQRLQQYFNLSDNRRAQIEKVLISHEKAKGNLIGQSLENLTENLELERERFFTELSKVLTPSEIDLYDHIVRSDFNNDRDHLMTLVEGFEMDSSYVQDYIKFQSEEVLPVLMQFRAELDLVISSADRNKLNSVRNDVFDMFDDCLVICLSHAEEPNDGHSELSNSNLLVNLNRELKIKDSNINVLLALTKKYEADIDEVRFKNREVFKKWRKKVGGIEDHHFLANHRESFNRIIRKNDISSLRHIESDAILLLLDPKDERKSRYFLNFGIHSQL